MLTPMGQKAATYNKLKRRLSDQKSLESEMSTNRLTFDSAGGLAGVSQHPKDFAPGNSMGHPMGPLGTADATSSATSRPAFRPLGPPNTLPPQFHHDSIPQFRDHGHASHTSPNLAMPPVRRTITTLSLATTTQSHISEFELVNGVMPTQVHGEVAIHAPRPIRGWPSRAPSARLPVGRTTQGQGTPGTWPSHVIKPTSHSPLALLGLTNGSTERTTGAIDYADGLRVRDPHYSQANQTPRNYWTDPSPTMPPVFGQATREIDTTGDMVVPGSRTPFGAGVLGSSSTQMLNETPGFDESLIPSLSSIEMGKIEDGAFLPTGIQVALKGKEKGWIWQELDEDDSAMSLDGNPRKKKKMDGVHEPIRRLKRQFLNQPECIEFINSCYDQYEAISTTYYKKVNQAIGQCRWLDDIKHADGTVTYKRCNATVNIGNHLHDPHGIRNHYNEKHANGHPVSGTQDKRVCHWELSEDGTATGTKCGPKERSNFARHLAEHLFILMDPEINRHCFKISGKTIKGILFDDVVWRPSYRTDMLVRIFAEALEVSILRSLVRVKAASTNLERVAGPSRTSNN